MWDIPDAEVVCKQLDCGPAVSAPHSNTRVGAFLLNNVRCHGNESHLWQCESDRWDREDCKSESDALVVCSESVSGKQGLLAEQGDLELRLGESVTPCTGVVEVYYRGVWGCL
nr:PREDICTED: scavenger receptor cysteine-rich type 1 protein M130-like [Latimeria chalumnae]|eukprot:XP_014349701.1 PREDICTED: scavenger receptor cysteine-rich type 1 protein M130-like [Latimeria chalumnae]